MEEAVASLVGPVEETRRDWAWHLALGIGFIVLGVGSIYATSVPALASVVAIGAILIAAGTGQLAAALLARRSRRIGSLLAAGAMDVVAGAALVGHPGLGALDLTIAVALLAVLGGLYRFIAALSLDLPDYGWVALSGITSLVLGILLWMQWSFSTLWFVGVAVGLGLLFAGVAWAALAIKLKRA